MLKQSTMKTTTILPIASISLASLAALSFSSCALDPDYKEYKKQKAAGTASTGNAYGAPAAGAANPYGVPQTGGETGSYTATGQAAPYQPLPGVSQPSTPAYSDTPSSTGAPAAGGSSHTVVSGDSLWGLAKKYGTSIESLQAANGLTTTNIRTGQTLTIPGR